MKVFGPATILLAAFGLLGPPAPASARGPADQPPLAVATFGGALMRSQMRAVVRPYRAESGRWVRVVEHDGSLAPVARQVQSENVVWDVVNVNLSEARRGCRDGLFVPIDPGALARGADGTPARDDFYPDALGRCSVGHNVSATVVAYARGAFDDPPTRLADFFDTDRFPGNRGLRRDPRVALEWALLADGVPRDRLYPTLATEEGLERALDRLDRIRDRIVWWTDGDAAAELVAAGRVAMGSAWNGRVAAANRRGADLAILWDGQVWNADAWVIPRGSDRAAEALDFIRYATRSEVLARQAAEIPYAPARRSAQPLVSETDRAQLPTSAPQSELAIRIDYAWWSEHGDEMRRRFEGWIEREPVFDFRSLDRN
ncbi:MAG: extracellular solute-binding protein [Myxococcota bacterium]